jgi:putative ABC transport system permease protein
MQIQKSFILILYQIRTAFKSISGMKGHSVLSLTGPALALARQIPQIEKAIHFLYLYGGRNIGKEEQVLRENGIATDSDFLEVFNFTLISGNASDLDDLNTIFLSSDLAEKLFPGTDPVNQKLIYKGDQVMVVRGVFKNCPDNSSLQFDFLIPYEAEVDFTTDWQQLSDATFIKLLPSADPDEVHTLMRQVWSTHVPYEQYDIGMISIADLRYGADFEFFNVEHGHGDTNKLYIFIGVALLILVLACLNYLILASSNAMKKEKSIWIRKVFGADSRSIMISQNQYIFKMFLPGMAIGCALAWFIVKKWLENYAYRNEIELWIFILGPALILLLALLSVSFQTWKASRQVPAISLKYQ